MQGDELPIERYRAEILDRLAPGRPVVVTAPTGSGKSTRLPLWLAERCGGPVLVVEPRRVACRSLASYLAERAGEPVGQGVGYRIRFTDCSGEATRILFVTPGVALRLVAEGLELPYRAVMLDEFHERGWEVDLVLTVLRRRPDGPPLVVTSATVDAGRLAADVGGTAVVAEGRLHPVTVEYDEALSAPTTRGLDRRVAAAVRRVLVEEPSGDVLVFLPGWREIDDCWQALQPVAAESACELFRVHGSMPTERLGTALSAHDGPRRVFLSTNVAETSITVPGVTAVVDGGLVRMRRHRAGRSGLVLEPVAADSAEQRAGRAGRLRPGRCLRLWSRAFKPDERTLPAVERVELADCLLHAAACGIRATEWSSAPWPTVPPAFAVEAARARLEALGAIDRAGAITDFGRRLLQVPVSVHQARLLVDPPGDVRGALADLLALLQGRGRLLLPLDGLRGERAAAVLAARRILFDEASDEVVAELRCLRYGKVGDHHLHSSALGEVRDMAAALRALLGCPVTDPTKDDEPLPPRNRLAAALLARWPDGGFVVRERALQRRGKEHARGRQSSGGEPWANGELELTVHQHPLWGTAKADGGRLPRAGVVLDHEWVGGRGNEVRGVGRMVLPCTRAELAAAGCGVDVVAAPRLVEGRVVGVVERTLAGVVLRHEERELEGATLRQALVELIVRGELWPQGWQALQDGLFVARALRRDGVPEAAEALADRLAELGVETAGDVALVDDEDLRVDVVDRFGLDGDEVRTFAADFPRRWSHQGAEFDCVVDLVRRTVDVVPVNQTARKLSSLPALVLPPFRGFTVRLRYHDRVVTLR